MAKIVRLFRIWMPGCMGGCTTLCVRGRSPPATHQYLKIPNFSWESLTGGDVLLISHFRPLARDLQFRLLLAHIESVTARVDDEDEDEDEYGHDDEDYFDGEDFEDDGEAHEDVGARQVMGLSGIPVALYLDTSPRICSMVPSCNMMRTTTFFNARIERTLLLILPKHGDVDSTVKIGDVYDFACAALERSRENNTNLLGNEGFVLAYKEFGWDAVKDFSGLPAGGTSDSANSNGRVENDLKVSAWSSTHEETLFRSLRKIDASFPPVLVERSLPRSGEFLRDVIMSQLSAQKISATLWMFFLRHLHLQMTVTRNFPSADILQKLITNVLREVVRKTHWRSHPEPEATFRPFFVDAIQAMLSHREDTIWMQLRDDIMATVHVNPLVLWAERRGGESEWLNDQSRQVLFRNATSVSDILSPFLPLLIQYLAEPNQNLSAEPYHGGNPDFRGEDHGRSGEGLSLIFLWLWPQAQKPRLFGFVACDFLRPKPDKAGPRPWLSGQAKARKTLVVQRWTDLCPGRAGDYAESWSDYPTRASETSSRNSIFSRRRKRITPCGNDTKHGNRVVNRESAQIQMGRNTAPLSADIGCPIPSAVRAHAVIQIGDSVGIATKWGSSV
ncbi:hypothetical protein B0H13DRAFT_1873676 [Mycena leptocephala]|nr:hypothetical protein B0H13DRAFT_1873676 [Mycena leptocephala]